jgi:hypothetical protein
MNHAERRLKLAEERTSKTLDYAAEKKKKGSKENMD